MIQVAQVAPEDITAMVNLMNSVYQAQDADSDTDGVQITDLAALKSALENAAINGSASIDGLVDLTGVTATTDIDPTAGGTDTIADIVSSEVTEGMTEFAQVGNTKTIDEIFRESIEDTIDTLQSYDPDIFSGT